MIDHIRKGTHAEAKNMKATLKHTAYAAGIVAMCVLLGKIVTQVQGPE